MDERGIDIRDHRPRQLTDEVIHDHDVIVCMEELHRRAVLQLAPAAVAIVLEVTDPHG